MEEFWKHAGRVAAKGLRCGSSKGEASSGDALTTAVAATTIPTPETGTKAISIHTLMCKAPIASGLPEELPKRHELHGGS